MWFPLQQVKPDLRRVIGCAGGIGHAGGETGFPPGVITLVDDFPDGGGGGGGGGRGPVIPGGGGGGGGGPGRRLTLGSKGCGGGGAFGPVEAGGGGGGGGGGGTNDGNC